MSAQTWLEGFLARQGGVAGTVHRHVDGVLRLEAAVNIPEVVRRATAEVPRGKGMAGLALERERPVSTCNLQAPSPDVNPGARAVDAAAAVALPIRGTDGRIRAVVGIAYSSRRELSDAELQAVADAAHDLP
jgi:L-methionine (R)-S-oxide reductase